MSKARRNALVAVGIVALAVAVTAGLLLSRGDGSVTTLGASSGEDGRMAVAAQTPSPTSTAGVDAGILDPAKQEPILDLFTAKDPFAPLGGVVPGPTPLPTPQPTSTGTTPSQFPDSADIAIDDVEYTVVVGDEVPPDLPTFYIIDVLSTGVTFEFVDGEPFEDGSTSVEVAEGQEILVTGAETGETYSLAVLSLNYAGGGGSNGGGGGGTNGGGTNGGGTADGHTIEVLSINTQGGVDTATFKVDGTTYADKAVGDTFSTDYGEIKVLAIDPAAQTVTILHGDNTLVLKVGQQIEK